LSDEKADITNLRSNPVVTAIAHQGDRLKAVCLRKQGSGFEVLWRSSGDVGRTGWQEFALECGLSPAGAPEARDGDNVVVAGFDSAGVVFYRMDVPSVKEKEMAAIVSLQTEARIPLPAEQMEMTWRRGPERNTQATVTVAAARKEHLRRFVEEARSVAPSMILLNCEAIVEVWMRFFHGTDEPSVIVKIGSHSTAVCLAQDGRLANAMRLDIGMEDFSVEDKTPAQSSKAAERFAQDLGSVLDLFGSAEHGQLGVYVLSDGGMETEAIVSSLASAGMNVKAALADCAGLRAEGRFGVEDVYEYSVPLGLATIVLDGRNEALNIFEDLYAPPGKKENKHWIHSPKVTSVIAGVMLVLMVVVFYLADVASEKRLTALKSEPSFKQYMQRQDLVRKAASEKPDMLGLLKEISDTAGGIQLDSLDFRKGRPLTIAGQSQGSEQLYKFQKNLLEQKQITDVKIQNTNKGKDGDKIKFTISFQYGRFTKKSRQARLRLGRSPIR